MYHYLTSLLYLFARRFLVVHGVARLSLTTRRLVRSGSSTNVISFDGPRSATSGPASAVARSGGSMRRSLLLACCHLTPLNTALESHLTHLHLVAYYFELAPAAQHARPAAPCAPPPLWAFGRRAEGPQSRSAPGRRSPPELGRTVAVTTTVDGGPRAIGSLDLVPVCIRCSRRPCPRGPCGSRAPVTLVGGGSRRGAAAAGEGHAGSDRQRRRAHARFLGWVSSSSLLSFPAPPSSTQFGNFPALTSGSFICALLCRT